MKGKLIIGNDGTFRITIDEGSYEDASGTLKALLEALTETLPFAEFGEIEQHRHDKLEAHIHAHNE